MNSPPATPNEVQRITKRLALVLPLDVAGGRVHYVYSQPLPTEVFKRFWRVFSKTFAMVYTENLHMMAGPRIAALAMRDFAAQLDMSEDVELGVFGEIRRLSYLVHPVEGRGWTHIMLDDAVRSNLITPEDYEEVENILTFFTVNWSMHRPGTREVIIAGAAKLWDAQTTSSTCSEFIASLPKSIVTESSGAKIKVA